MKAEEVIDVDWPYLVACLPELEESARELGALTRRRAVDSAETLLRLALVHAACDHSLRETAAWAEAVGVASISDVALLKRFRRCGPWLGHLVLAKLAERSQWNNTFDTSMRIRLVDATHIGGPGAKGLEWRVHLSLDLKSLSIDHVELSDYREGESLNRFPVAAGELLVGDRGYAHRDAMARVAHAGAFFLVRLPWSTVPLEETSGGPFDLFRKLRSIPHGGFGEFSVVMSDCDGKKTRCRLIALRKSAVSSEAARNKILSRKSKKGKRRIDVRTLEAAEYTILLTNLDHESLSCMQAAEIYRLRWQIELAFKRFKSLLNLDQLAAREPKMVQTYVLAKILGALLVDDLTNRYLSFFPWGYPIRNTAGIDLETPQIAS